LDLSILPGLALFSFADAIMYLAFFFALRALYKRHRLAVQIFLILVSPFAYVLATAGTLFNVLWMLFFTPLYGVIVLGLLYPTWIVLYYCIALGIFAILNLLLRKHRKNQANVKDPILKIE
jgi:hypothetical protein